MVGAPDSGRPRGLGARFVIALVAVAFSIAALGALYVVAARQNPAPTFPSAPPGAHRLWASQSAPMLGTNDIVSLALYRVAGAPTIATRYYTRVLPGHGGAIGRFRVVVRDAAEAALPTALQHLPRQFVTGAGRHAEAHYTFTEYATARSDVGIAVDLRHPRGPTLVFVEMLSQ